MVDESIRFLETRDRTRPFFLMSSFVRPHPPFDAPATYYAMYQNKWLARPLQSDWMKEELTQSDGMRMDSMHGCNDFDMRHDAMAGYYACITHVDHQIGRLITALENDESFQDTLIIFTSDHGEMLFDHSLFRKALPYQSSIHIPFVIHIGKNIQVICPHKSKEIVELRDILPTILDIADIQIPTDVDGLSLKDVLYQNATLQRDYLHGEHSGNTEQSNQWILSENDKYIWFTQTGIEQFFDLKQDPDETHNLIHDPQYQPQIKKAKSRLIQALRNREEGYSDGHTLINCQPPRNILQNIK